MVIFAITALVAPYLKGWQKVLPWALAAAVCLSRVYLGAHFPLDVVAGGSRHLDRQRAQPSIRRAQHQFQDSLRRRAPVSSTPSTPCGGFWYRSIPGSPNPACLGQTHPLPLRRRATDHGRQAIETTSCRHN